jgi:hypothetical protein
MTTRRVIYTRPDGGISVLAPAAGARLADESEDDFVQRIILKDVPADATDVRVIDASEVPKDRTFRNAWRQQANELAVDMPKARAIHMDRIRRARQSELERLDLEWMRAMGRKDQPAADVFEAKRERLRNIPQTFDLTGAATPEELGALWPADLPRS